MQEPQVGWDLTTVYYRPDHPLQLTVLYLAVSILVFIVLAIRFFLILARFRKALAALRAHSPRSSESKDQDAGAADSAASRFRAARRSIHVALTTLRSWTRLTIWILLAYSATEIAALLRIISDTKVIGRSALSGALAQVFTIWSLALCFLAALSSMAWILSHHLARTADLRDDAPDSSA